MSIPVSQGISSSEPCLALLPSRAFYHARTLLRSCARVRQLRQFGRIESRGLHFIGAHVKHTKGQLAVKVSA